MKTEFTTFDIINSLGIPRGRLREWINEGFVVPSVQKAEGVGTKAIFDMVDIVGLVLFKHLIESHKIVRSEAASISGEWVHVVHVFQRTFGKELTREFLKTYPFMQIIRRQGNLIVGLLVIYYLLVFFLQDKKQRNMFMDAVGHENIDSALTAYEVLFRVEHDHITPLAKDKIKSGKANPKFVKAFQKLTESEPEIEYDSLLQINFRKIMEETKKVLE